MARKAVFLDRDGTINVDTNYLYKSSDFSFLPGAKEGLKALQSAGYMLVVITNQSGIARGMYEESDYLALNQWMLEELKKDGIEIAATYYCPHHPQAVVEKYRIDCDCRKPKIGLFKKAAAEHGIDEANSWTVGDRMRDLAFCEHSKARGILLYSGCCERAGSVWKIKGGLKEAAQKIVSENFE